MDIGKFHTQVYLQPFLLKFLKEAISVSAALKFMPTIGSRQHVSAMNVCVKTLNLNVRRQILPPTHRTRKSSLASRLYSRKVRRRPGCEFHPTSGMRAFGTTKNHGRKGPR